MSYAEFIEFYNTPVLIGKPEADKYLILAAQMMAEEGNEMLLRRHKPKKNNFSELLELYMTPVPAVREEEEPRSEVKEEEMKCLLCGCDMQYKTPYSGRPLTNQKGVVCHECWRTKVLPYEQQLKSNMPDSIQYFPRSSDLED